MSLRKLSLERFRANKEDVFPDVLSQNWLSGLKKHTLSDEPTKNPLIFFKNGHVFPQLENDSVIAYAKGSEDDEYFHLPPTFDATNGVTTMLEQNDKLFKVVSNFHNGLHSTNSKFNARWTMRSYLVPLISMGKPIRVLARIGLTTTGTLILSVASPRSWEKLDEAHECAQLSKLGIALCPSNHRMIVEALGEHDPDRLGGPLDYCNAYDDDPGPPGYAPSSPPPDVTEDDSASNVSLKRRQSDTFDAMKKLMLDPDFKKVIRNSILEDPELRKELRTSLQLEQGQESLLRGIYSGNYGYKGFLNA